MKTSKIRNFLLLVLLVSCVTTLKWTKRKEDCIVMSEYQIAQYIGAFSVGKCLLYCEMTPGCESSSWYQGNGTCVAFNRNVVEDTRAQYTKWMPLADWKTFSRVIYPVVRRFNPDPTKGFMTFEEAKQICKDQESIIATPADLLASRNMGMDNCYCCWLSNGLVGMVTANVDSCPQHGYSTDVIYCNQTNAAAWCKLR